MFGGRTNQKKPIGVSVRLVLYARFEPLRTTNQEDESLGSWCVWLAVMGVKSNQCNANVQMLSAPVARVAVLVGEFRGFLWRTELRHPQLSR